MKIEDRNEHLICRNEKKNELIFENWNGAVEIVPFKMKGTRKGTNSLLKGTLTTLCFPQFLVEASTRQ